MTSAKLACPKCRRAVPEVYWQGVDVARCPGCESEFEQMRFPALDVARRVDRAAQTAAGEANCYFHAQNRAEAACDGCGRFVCAVCRVPFSGQHFCPSCLENRSDRRKLPENQRVLHDHIALALALVPLIVWPFTLFTAPAALALCIFGWKRPGSLVGRGRKVRFVIAGILASLEIVGWMLIFGRMLLK